MLFIYFLASYQGVLPSFVMKPKDQQAIEGSTVILYCSANGRDRNGEMPRISWLKDGTTLNLESVTKFYNILEAGHGCRATKPRTLFCNATNKYKL